MVIPEMPKQILVVEDDEVNLMIAEHVIHAGGYEVSVVNNGEEAIEIVQGKIFDMILMDIEMPIMDGMEATRAIRKMKNGRAIPIIALTAHHIPEKIAEFRATGMDDHIIKPIDLPKFQEIVEKHLY